VVAAGGLKQEQLEKEKKTALNVCSLPQHNKVYNPITLIMLLYSDHFIITFFLKLSVRIIMLFFILPINLENPFINFVIKKFSENFLRI